MRCKPQFLQTFHLLEHCSVPWLKGPRFKLISPDSNNNNWEIILVFIFKLQNWNVCMYKWFMISWVISDGISSPVLI